MSTRRPHSRARASAPSYDPAPPPAPAFAPSPPPSLDPWAEEAEREALSRRFGHLDLDRGVFASAPSEGLGTGAKVGLAAGAVAALGALGALAWWLWPSSGAGPGGAQKTVGGPGMVHGPVSAHPASTHMAVPKGFAEGFAAAQDGRMLLIDANHPVWPAGHMFQLNTDGTYFDLGLRSVAPAPLKAGS